MAEQLGPEDGVAASPHRHPRLGADDTSNLEAPAGRLKLPTKLSLWPRGQERPSQQGRRLTDGTAPLQPDPASHPAGTQGAGAWSPTRLSLPPSRNAGCGSLESQALWAVTAPPTPPAMQSGRRGGSLDCPTPWHPGACPLLAGVVQEAPPSSASGGRGAQTCTPTGSNEAGLPSITEATREST